VQALVKLLNIQFDNLCQVGARAEGPQAEGGGGLILSVRRKLWRPSCAAVNSAGCVLGRAVRLAPLPNSQLN
jgi:hypothetical protein